MASSWIRPWSTQTGKRRHKVEFRTSGRHGKVHYGGVFKTQAEARIRKQWIDGELAACRFPRIELLAPDPVPVVTLRQAFEDFRASRVDVAEATEITYRTSQERVLAAVGDIPVDRIDPAWVARLVSALHQNGAARESIRKTRAHLAMAIDFAGIAPNPVRDRSVKLPRLQLEEVTVPTAVHVEATFYALASKYRLPHLIYDATGERLRELEQLEWRDVDELERQWKVRAGIEKRRRARWVPLGRFPNEDALLIFEAVTRLVPREDRDPHARVLGFDGDAYRTELRRACQATGTPLFTPNDLRHRRATLWHLQHVADVDAASWLGNSVEEQHRTYLHANLDDRSEVDYATLLFDLKGGNSTTKGCSHEQAEEAVPAAGAR